MTYFNDTYDDYEPIRLMTYSEAEAVYDKANPCPIIVQKSHSCEHKREALNTYYNKREKCILKIMEVENASRTRDSTLVQSDT